MRFKVMSNEHVIWGRDKFTENNMQNIKNIKLTCIKSIIEEEMNLEQRKQKSKKLQRKNVI